MSKSVDGIFHGCPVDIGRFADAALTFPAPPGLPSASRPRFLGKEPWMPIHAYAAKGPKQKLEPFTYDPGPLGPHEVEVRVTHCGVCHSDIAMLDNDWGFTTYPEVAGHEVVGVIAAVGSDVPERVKVGMRVGVGWQCGSCGACEWCSTGLESLCPWERPTIVKHHGGFADAVRTDWHFAADVP